MLTTLDHVILAVGDLDQATRDYQTLLGLAPSWSGVHPGAGTANVLFRLDNSYLELLAPEGEGPIGAMLQALLEARGDGLLGVVFGTDDIDACRQTLIERGLNPGPVESGQGRDQTTGATRSWRRAALPMDATRGVLVFPIQHDSEPDVLPFARATHSPESAVHAFDHVVVQTTDPEATRKLYGDLLGIRLALDKEFPDWGVRLMFFRIGGVTLEIAGALGSATKTDGEPSNSGNTLKDGERATPSSQTGADASPMSNANAESGQDRLYGMTYRVPDAEAARARLAGDGLDVSGVRAGRRPGTRVFTVRNGTCGVPTLMLEFTREKN